MTRNPREFAKLAVDRIASEKSVNFNLQIPFGYNTVMDSKRNLEIKKNADGPTPHGWWKNVTTAFCVKLNARLTRLTPKPDYLTLKPAFRVCIVSSFARTMRSRPMKA
jgi:hypothetical protein